MARLPPWIRTSLRTDRAFVRTHDLVSDLGLHTVCRSARCPNIHECWNRGTATIMILGGVCTRRCGFCAVTAGAPAPVDPEEPGRVARAVQRMGLRYVVVTSVTRDDLEDGGAAALAATIGTVRRECPSVAIEVLTPDFQGSEQALAAVLGAGPDVFGHNIETVRRLQPAVRPQASYERSLAVLRYAAAWRPKVAVKSGLMAGLGETDEEIGEAMADLAAAGCSLLTLGQYLAPTRAHLPVGRFVSEEEFRCYEEEARCIGFSGVAAGPLVRSSYRAEELMASVGGG